MATGDTAVPGGGEGRTAARAAGQRPAGPGAGAPGARRSGTGARLPSGGRAARPRGLRRHARGGRHDRPSARAASTDNRPRRLRRRRCLLHGGAGHGAAAAGGGCGLVPARPGRRRLRAEGGHRAAAGRPRHRAAGERGLRDRGRRGGRAGAGLGLEVVVTDHHAPPADGVLPRAPIVHPAVCGYPCRSCAPRPSPTSSRRRCTRTAARDPRELEAELDLVALATIADVVPLVGENRTLAVRGLRAPGEHRASPGLRALMEVARVAPGKAGESGGRRSLSRRG